MNILLRLFSIDTLIAAVISYISTTVKNPSSSKALQLRSIVHRLYKAAKQFLEQTGGIPEDS